MEQLSKLVSRFTFAAFFLSIGISLLAQSTTITGRVIDADSEEGMYGATVLVGARGTSTDFDGTFSISVDDVTESLKISHVGYDPSTVTIDQLKSLNGIIALVLSDNLLQTAVVTGSKYEQSISESVVSIDVLKPQLIKNGGELRDFP